MNYRKLEGIFVLFCTLSFFGIFLWIGWNYLILNDPFYFTNSPFSAKSQQQGWQELGMLPTHNNLFLSLVYYATTAAQTIGVLLTFVASLGVGVFIVAKFSIKRLFIVLLLFVPFLFYWVTMYMGQSVIFIPTLTPEWYEWRLFNVRYGVMMIPAAAFFIGYLGSFSPRLTFFSLPIILSFVSFFSLLQSAVFATGRESVITYQDGVNGLSAASTTHAQLWLAEEYDGGLILMDDYARTTSIIKTNIPMENTIYIGNRVFWEESLNSPETYARWIIMQENDAVWKALHEDHDISRRIYSHFERVYTSDNILIFKKAS